MADSGGFVLTPEGGAACGRIWGGVVGAGGLIDYCAVGASILGAPSLRLVFGAKRGYRTS